MSEAQMPGGAVYPSLRNRVVLVTGGGSGIGASIVERFCAQGSRVSFIDNDEEASTALVERIAEQGGTTPRFVPSDLRDIAATKNAIGEIIAAEGAVRILINNAARDDRHAIDEVTPEYFDERIAVNLRHQFFATQAVYPSMAEAGGGSIINMGSVSWIIGQGGMPIYSASKSAVMGLTRSLACDLGPMNIRVNSVLPGWTMTERQIKLWLTPESEAEMLRQQCLKRRVEPDDIARVVLFFSSDDAGACTNQNYIVDGGWT